eukprot:1625631-Rhodomonas_salina.1
MEVYGLAPCVITYTTLINGLCKAGDISAAFKVVRDMTARKPPVLPNIRSPPRPSLLPPRSSLLAPRARASLRSHIAQAAVQCAVLRRACARLVKPVLR